MADRAVHRVVLESLTNAAKHAPGATVTVTVRHTHADTVVRVVNGPPPSPPTPSAGSGNHGLHGMRERVRLAGGTLHAAPAGGGFEVVARLPHLEAPPDLAGIRHDVPAEHSESARHLERVRRRARRGLVATVVVPTGLATVLVTLMAGCYVLVGYLSVLSPEDFVRLRLGQARSEVEATLPPLQMLDAPSERGPAPRGAVCRHYRPQGEPGIRYAYRLCFAGDRLVAKHAVPTGSTRPSDVPTEGTGAL